MALVKEAHCGDETDLRPLAPARLERLAQLVDRANDAHAYSLCASARVAAASVVQSGNSSGVRAATAAACRSAVARSPRTMGPVSALRPPALAQFSTAALTSGASSSRRTPASVAMRSAAASSVTR